MLRALTVISVLACLLPFQASAQDERKVDRQLADLNRQALDAYQNLDIDGARLKLERALKIAQRANHGGATVAQTFLALGLVYVAGMNDQEQGLAAFVNALCVQRDVQLDPLLSTPSVKQVFAQAQNDVRSGACGPDAASAQQAPPEAAPAAPPRAAPTPEAVAVASSAATPTAAPDTTDVENEPECPPGMRCGGHGDDSDSRSGPNSFARFFIDVQGAVGFSWLRSGMQADSLPPALYTAKDPPPMTDVYRVTQDPVTMENRFVFNTDSPWVPDADSFDDVEPRGQKNVSENCVADGKESGPIAAGVTDKYGRPFTTMTPSKYCVRVAKPGFVPGFALRGNLGYFISDNFALSVPLRFQFNAGIGPLAHILIGLRGELMFTPMKRATGTSVSWFFGGTYGQIQARPSSPAGAAPGPYAESGPFGVHTGLNVRIRVHRNFGFIISPEFNLLIPALLPHADLSAGIETAF